MPAATWSAAIDAWQAPYINDDSKPLWYRGMLFNELYALADLGGFWGRPISSDTKAPPVFSFMECYDYPYYETLDVRFYGLRFQIGVRIGGIRDETVRLPVHGVGGLRKNAMRRHAKHASCSAAAARDGGAGDRVRERGDRRVPAR